MAKYVEVDKMVYVMYCYVGMENESGEMEDIFDHPEEYYADTQEELKKLWDKFVSEEDGIYGYYGDTPAYYTDHIISDEKEKRTFYEKVTE